MKEPLGPYVGLAIFVAIMVVLGVLAWGALIAVLSAS